MSDMSPPDLPYSAARRPTFQPFAEFLLSLQFLTRLPIPFIKRLDPPPLAQAMRFFSLAGGLIALPPAAVLVLGHFARLPSLTSALLATVALLLTTGALHDDGLADTADGLLGGRSREQRLEIMRDSRIGTYGACALVMALLLRVSAYQILGTTDFLHTALLLASAGAFSRALMVDLLWATRPARLDGLAVYAGKPSRGTALAAITIGALLTLYAGFALTGLAGAVVSMAAATIVTSLVRHAANKMIGGQTGDICGAAQVLSEVAMLICYAAMIG